MKVLTKVGEIETPELEEIGPRTRYWAEAMQDLLRTDEIFCVMGAALEEAFRAGTMHAMSRILDGWEKSEVIEVEAEVVEEDGKETEEAVEGGDEGGSSATAGPEPEGPAGPDPGPGSAEPPAPDAELPGGVPEGTRS